MGKCDVPLNTAKKAVAQIARPCAATRNVIPNAQTHRPSASPFARSLCVTGNATAPTTAQNPSALLFARSPRTARSLQRLNPVLSESSLLDAFLYSRAPLAGL